MSCAYRKPLNGIFCAHRLEKGGDISRFDSLIQLVIVFLIWEQICMQQNALI